MQVAGYEHHPVRSQQQQRRLGPPVMRGPCWLFATPPTAPTSHWPARTLWESLRWWRWRGWYQALAQCGVDHPGRGSLRTHQIAAAALMTR